MKKHLKKLRSALTLVSLTLIASLVLSSCGVIIINDTSDTTQPSDTTAPADSTTSERIDKSPTLDYLSLAKDFLAALPSHNFNGAEKTIVGIGAAKLGGIDEDSVGTVMGLNRGKRNSAVESACNTTLKFEELADDILFDELLLAINSGEQFSDLIVIPQDELAKFVIKGLLYDVSTLDCGFAEQPYYDYSAIQATGGAAAYGVIGDATTDPDYLYGVYFNKAIIEESGLESPYALAASGQWTIDKYVEYIAAVKEKKTDVEGFTLHGFTEQNYADVLYFGGENSLTTSVLGLSPVATFPSELSDILLSKIHTIFNNGTKYNGNSPENDFTAGKMLFYVAPLSRSNALSADIDFGVVPVPKATADQVEYRTIADPNMPIIAVPANITDTDGTGYLIDALFASSFKFLTSAYAEHQMSYYLRDSMAIDMVYKIANSAVYDAAYMYGPQYTAISNGTYTAVRRVAISGGTMANYYASFSGRTNTAYAFLGPQTTE